MSVCIMNAEPTRSEILKKVVETFDELDSKMNELSSMISELDSNFLV